MKSGKIIVGNWKMDPQSKSDAQELIATLGSKLTKSKKAQAIICPPYIHLPYAIAMKNGFDIGAQNVSVEAKGSFTGEISVGMLISYGVKYIIIGHSERRAMGESDELINKKVLLALKSGLTPIICVGEKVRDHDGSYLAQIKSQIESALKGVKKTEIQKVIIAYEPIWAIGSDSAMAPRDIHEMTIYIKKILVDLFKIKGKVSVPILYGGAVDPLNAQSILSEGEADGLLIGRASLDARNFIEIINIAQNL